MAFKFGPIPKPCSIHPNYGDTGAFFLISSEKLHLTSEKLQKKELTSEGLDKFLSSRKSKQKGKKTTKFFPLKLSPKFNEEARVSKLKFGTPFKIQKYNLHSIPIPQRVPG